METGPGPMQPTGEPSIVSMSRSAGELVFALRRRDDELRAFCADVSDERSRLRQIIANLSSEEHVAFEAEIPQFLIGTLDHYEELMSPKAVASPAAAGGAGRLVRDVPQA